LQLIELKIILFSNQNMDRDEWHKEIFKNSLYI